jgi:MFS family permease
MTDSTTQHGLRANAFQFWMLVLVNAFVGGMVGLERAILPQIAEVEFGMESKTAILSFIVAFGLTKAITNYLMGRLANKVGRRKLLILGWLFAIPVPFLLMYAQDWNIIILANIFLGINQGLAWSSTVVMKIDLVGPKERGLAMGLNEFSGYLAVGIAAFASAYLANIYGLRPYPFYLGVVFILVGLLLSVFVIEDTRKHVVLESKSDSSIDTSESVWLNTTFFNKNLSATTQAGLINNLNDGMIWGLLPLLLINQAFGNDDIGLIAAIYPAVWGISQLFTGRLADLISNKKILFWGMFLQGVAIIAFVLQGSVLYFSLLAVVLGVGTALVYPTFFVVIANNTTPDQRAESIGVFRFWRDAGYAIGAIMSGILADLFSIEVAIIVIGILTVLSSVIIKIRMSDIGE